jgi:hypothetical protein
MFPFSAIKIPQSKQNCDISQLGKTAAVASATHGKIFCAIELNSMCALGDLNPPASLNLLHALPTHPTRPTELVFQLAKQPGGMIRRD